jgi:hypothetical protein
MVFVVFVQERQLVVLVRVFVRKRGDVGAFGVLKFLKFVVGVTKFGVSRGMKFFMVFFKLIMILFKLLDNILSTYQLIFQLQLFNFNLIKFLSK